MTFWAMGINCIFKCNQMSSVWLESDFSWWATVTPPRRQVALLQTHVANSACLSRTTLGALGGLPSLLSKKHLSVCLEWLKWVTVKMRWKRMKTSGAVSWIQTHAALLLLLVKYEDTGPVFKKAVKCLSLFTLRRGRHPEVFRSIKEVIKLWGCAELALITQ